MFKNPRSHRLALAAAVALCFGTALPAAAAPVTRSFEFSSTSGPLQFGPTLGSFTYDSALAPLGGGVVSALNLFSDLAVTFGSFSYDETTANSGWLTFDASGDLVDAHFGNNCVAGTCSISGGSNHWWVRVGTSSVNDFAYALVGHAGIWTTDQNRLVPLNVPEPTPLALLAVAGLAAVAARRRA